jgi:hypothetical protein
MCSVLRVAVRLVPAPFRMTSSNNRAKDFFREPIFIEEARPISHSEA